MKFRKVHNSFEDSSNLLPADDKTKDWCDKLKNGEVFDADVQTMRNYQQLKMFWATCKCIAENYRKEIYRDLDSARKVCEYVKLKLGFVDYRIVMKDHVHLKTKSISYSKMSQEEWQKFMNDAMIVLNKISSLDKLELLLYENDVEDDR